MTKNEKKNYVCVNCGESVKTLYKQYSFSVLKLCTCEHCGNVADKYLEYDKVIILIDLILFNKEAYRHALYNIQYKNHFKLALLQLIVVSINEWIYLKNSEIIQDSDVSYIFILVSLAVLLGKLSFFLILLLFLILYNNYYNKKKFVKSHVVKVWEAIVCSSFGYFLLLTVIIWNDFQREIHLLFIYLYILLSQIQALTVVTQVPRTLLGIICTLAAVVNHTFSAALMEQFGVYN